MLKVAPPGADNRLILPDASTRINFPAAARSVLLPDLKRLTTANMTEEIERLACALGAGLMLPEDF